jgi:tRNA threonylcarbamoyladenosine biosynthesis protein TsaE
MAESEIELALEDGAATDALGAALARTFPGSVDSGAALHLCGDLGAGKTTCVRSLLRALGITGLIRSPTYTLIETYRLDALTCVHTDLYRLQGPLEVDELGLRDFMMPGHLLLIEWPEKGGAALPPADVELSLGFAQHGRHARLRARTALGSRWLRSLRSDGSLTSYLSNLI